MIKENTLSPKSIAIVGASQDKEKIGNVILRNLINGGYQGKIYPINPKYKEIEGKEAFPDILSIRDHIETVCIAIPYQFVSSIVDQCIQKKVDTVVIITAGFKETGEEGKKLEEEIYNKLKSSNIRLIGPNSLGYINNNSNINLSFARSNPGEGSIAFLSQSGAFATAILDMASKDNIGFSKIISIGNKPDINENDLIEYFEKDSDTTAVAMYLEEFTDGKDFVEIAQKLVKPVVVIAPGSSIKGTEAISSHTGSLARSYDVTLAAIKKGNLIKVESAEEMFDTLKVIAGKKIPKGRNIAIVTNAGGPGIMATDFVEQFHLHMAEIGNKTKEKLKKDLPIFASVNNPVDILGDAGLDRYENAIKTLIDDISVDTIIVILTPQLITDISGTAKLIADIQKQTSKPIFSCFLGGKEIEEGNKILRAYGLYYSNNIEDTVKVIHKLTEYSINETTYSTKDINSFKGKGKYKKEIQDILTDRPEVLPDDIAVKIVQEFDIDLPLQLITSNVDDGIQFASTHFPVVIKATAKDLTHKTDFKALFLDIRTVSEFQTRFMELTENIEKVTGRNNPAILIQEMIEPKGEFFIGANREGGSDIYEPQGLGFGHLIAIGQGGIYTEVHKDIQHILVPETDQNIHKALENTKISTIINGYRGKSPLAKISLIEMIDKVQAMLITYPEIVSLDINPVILTESRAIAVDIKVYISSGIQKEDKI